MSITYHSKICEIAHGAMTHLLAAGLIDMDRMTEFDRLCVNDQPARQADVAALSRAAASPHHIEKTGDAGTALASPTQSAPVTHASAPSTALPVQTGAPSVQQATSDPAFALQTAAALRALRLREGVNVAAFAHYLDVQPQAIVAWEAGFLRPSPPVARLLEIVAEKGLSAIR